MCLCFLPQYTACRTLVPRPGIKSRFPAVEAQSPNNQWTTREFPINNYVEKKFKTMNIN